jgi:TldD protein
VYNAILQAVLSEAEQVKVYTIGRWQTVQEISIVINNGKTERIVSEEAQGLGIQVFSQAGYSGFASSDSVSIEEAKSLVRKAAKLASLSKAYGGQSNKEIFAAQTLVTQVPSPLKYPWGKLSLPELEELTKVENNYVLQQNPGLSVQTAFRQILEQWQIVRSDGTNVKFSLPRAALIHTLTARSSHKTVTTRSSLGGMDIAILVEEDKKSEGRERCQQMADLARNLLEAKPVKGGHFKLVIDYALAKGLAHEAFGHAVETDGVNTSILGENGKLKLGMEVAAPIVSIVDGPLQGDWAYQPISANGIKRETVKIVDKGRLTAGLGDVFSARQAGVAISGAARVEGFDQIPLPRMTNIRIETDKTIPLDKPWHQVSPRELYQLLLKQKLIERDEEVYYLLGYKGGQVNTQHGDFVFNCSAVYRLADQPELFQPGIFAGKTLSALQAIKASIGPLLTDAMGTCGKWGQGVPSSGGSAAFLVLDSSPEITLGGE